MVAVLAGSAPAAPAWRPAARLSAGKAGTVGNVSTVGKAGTAGEVIRAARARTERTQAARVRARRRRVLVVGVILLLAGLWIALQATASGAGGVPLTSTGAAGGTPAAARVWVVRPGDTLWSIARAEQRAGDIRPLVDRLATETGGRPLEVGQRIPLP